MTSIISEMTDLEKHPSFNSDVKISGIDEEKSPNTTKPNNDDQKNSACATTSDEAVGGDCDMTGFAMFEEQAASEKPKSKFKMSKFNH